MKESVAHLQCQPMATPIFPAIWRFRVGRSALTGSGGRPNAVADAMHCISKWQVNGE